MAKIARTLKQSLELAFGKPHKKLRALALEESIKKCAEINATDKEIEKARTHLTKYVCEKCGYHSGNIRRCPVCGGWLRYWQVYERILEFRSWK